MARFSFLFIALALASSHGVFGAPSCSTDLGSCISKCKSKWHHHHHHHHTTSPYPAEPQKGSPTSGTMSNTPTPGPTSPPAAQPKPTPTPASSSSSPAPSSSSSSNSGGISPSDQQAILAAHNNLRSTHKANSLTWSNTLQSTALAWATQCKFQHSQGQFGENLFAGTGNPTIVEGFNAWAGEESDYQPSNPQFSHYTQIVWKGTTQLGCAYISCPGGTIFSDSSSMYLVCEYDPPGNVEGEFSQNVEP